MLLAVLGGIAYLLAVDRNPPLVEIALPGPIVNPDQEIGVTLRDQTPGLKTILVQITSGSSTVTLLERKFEESPPEATLSFHLGRENIRALFRDAPITVERNDLKLGLRIVAADASLARFGRGNEAELKMDLLVDLVPPQAEILSSPVQILQGRSEALIFRASEPLHSASLLGGENENSVTFTAYPQGNGIYACVFTLPHNNAPASFSPRLVLTDPAGNRTETNLKIQAQAAAFREDRINISPLFLKEKAAEFMRLAPGESDPLALFLRINNEVRENSYAELHGLREKTESAPLWQGAFMRLPNSIKRSEFADRRTYYYFGRVIDRQVHQGIDLASVLRDKIPAAENGRVIFAGYQGIHGNAVLLDHGLGVQTLYSHLSRIDVKPGALIRRGRTVGLTGVSGMAGGDHLHFEVFVNGISVDPDDWLAGVLPWKVVKTLGELR